MPSKSPPPRVSRLAKYDALIVAMHHQGYTAAAIADAIGEKYRGIICQRLCRILPPIVAKQRVHGIGKTDEGWDHDVRPASDVGRLYGSLRYDDDPRALRTVPRFQAPALLR